MEQDILRLVKKNGGMTLAEMRHQLGYNNPADRSRLQEAADALVKAGKIQYVDKQNKYYPVGNL